jgi:FkbM family methyltransferase
MMFQRFSFWKSKGLNPTVIYDIGANEGAWTREMKKVFPTAHYEEFEANKQHRRPGLNNVLLTDVEKDTAYYKLPESRHDMNSGASMYLEMSDHFAPGKYITETLHGIPLETYVEQNHLPPPDFLKMDVQGAELDILRGATSLLPNVKYAVLESCIHQWNLGAPRSDELIAFMAEHGFEILDFVGHQYVGGYLLYVDILFAKRSENLRCMTFHGNSVGEVSPWQ